MNYLINKDITAQEVRLVDAPEGYTDGVYPTHKALKIARELSLDLIQISVTTSPPPCKIMEFSKYKFELEKKQKEILKKQKGSELKEVRLGQNIGEHDLQTKVRQSIDFLKRGDRVKALLFFKGRGIVYKTQGEVVLLKFAAALEDYGIAESLPKLEGKQMFFIIKPKK